MCNLNREFGTFDIATILLTLFKISIYTEKYHSYTVSWSVLFWKFFVSGAAFGLDIGFQRLVCWFILKGLVPSHSAESYDFSRCGIINIWKNFDWRNKGLWTWIFELGSVLSKRTVFSNFSISRILVVTQIKRNFQHHNFEKSE